MKIREPRAGWTWFVWLWAAMFGGVPLFILVSGINSSSGDAPVPLLLLFPTVALAVLVPMVRRTLRVGFVLGADGIHGAHDAETTVVPWVEVERIAWRWARETSGVKVNGRPLPDGGEWSGTPPSRQHTTWDGADVPLATDSPLVFSSRDQPVSDDAPGDTEPRWPTAGERDGPGPGTTA